MAQNDRILARLTALHPKKIDLSLGRMERLLAALGNPHHRLPPVFHVAGTNGKGSTVAYLRAMLEAAGYTVHAYTSPHLVRFNERIRIAGNLIDDATLNDLLEECETANAGNPITFFEITTTVALLAFARTPADVVILEVGLGGRLDATNVIDRPLVSCITPVSMDHEQFLGHTLAAIAAEKAGIAKSGCPLVVAAQQPEARAVITRQAQQLGAPLHLEGADWRWQPQQNGFAYYDNAGTIALPHPALMGDHQLANAALAVACLRAQTYFTVSAAAMAQGISSAVWPARLQDITAAFTTRAPQNTQVLLDGGHNPAGAVTVADALKNDPRPTVAVMGMLANKDAHTFMATLRPHLVRLIATAIPGEDCHAPEYLSALASGMSLATQTAREPQAAIDAALKGIAPGGRLLICGSLYMAGQVLEAAGLLPE
jgi:dihydrofolate synthase/folylpolyglutamate synthase